MTSIGEYVCFFFKTINRRNDLMNSKVAILPGPRRARGSVDPRASVMVIVLTALMIIKNGVGLEGYGHARVKGTH